jgi:hypothetical protein
MLWVLALLLVCIPFLMEIHAAGLSIGGSAACVSVAAASPGTLVSIGSRRALFGANVAALHVCWCALPLFALPLCASVHRWLKQV